MQLMEQEQRLLAMALASGQGTPFVLVNLAGVSEITRRFRACMAGDVYYAVKANPDERIIRRLATEGVSFDIASRGEIERCVNAGVSTSRLSFGNTIKRASDIAFASSSGLRLFALDAEQELLKIARFAPGADVFCRIQTGSGKADWPLSRKFGCSPSMAIELLSSAKDLGLRPAGVSFHAGSQQRDPRAWGPPIRRAAGVFAALSRRGINLDFLNLGGGFPASYRVPAPPIEAYAEVIETALREAFGSSRPRIILEPGRHLTGDAGLLLATVLLTSTKSRRSRRRWIYIDAGRFNGLMETSGQAIRYRVTFPNSTANRRYPAFLAGPSCDSMDIIYPPAIFDAPEDVTTGDPVCFFSAGAYTASYASVEFNGFAPLPVHVADVPGEAESQGS